MFVLFFSFQFVYFTKKQLGAQNIFSNKAENRHYSQAIVVMENCIQ